MTLAVSQVVDAAVLRAPGERHDGKRELLGVSVALSEAGVNRRKFITDLKDRGMHGMQLFVSDDRSSGALKICPDVGGDASRMSRRGT